jgi:hypothetical protein
MVDRPLRSSSLFSAEVRTRLPLKRISPPSKKGLYRAILELLGNADFLWRASSSDVKISLCPTRTQCMRAAASSAAVSSPADFSLPRTFRRNRRTHAVVHTSFQYELNWEASMRLALIVAVRTWLGYFFFFSRCDLLVVKFPDGQYSLCFRSHDGPCHQYEVWKYSNETVSI